MSIRIVAWVNLSAARVDLMVVKVVPATIEVGLAKT